MLGARLRELRKEKRKTLRDVGIDLGIDYSGLAQIERGERNCNSTTLDLLARYYGVSTDYLLGNTDNPNTSIFTVADTDGTITTIEYQLIDKLKGLTVQDMIEIEKYVDYLKAKKEVEKNEK